MTPDEQKRFHQVEEIFHAALETITGEAREALIRERCGSDKGLRTAVDRSACAPRFPRRPNGCRASAPGKP